MSEAATSLQDARLHRESCEPSLPLDWISAVIRRGGGYSSIQIYLQRQRLTGLFSWSSLFKLVINRSRSRRSQATGLTFWPHSRCQTTCAFIPFGTILLQSSSMTRHSSFWLLWMEPKLPEFLSWWGLPVFMREMSLHLFCSKSLPTSVCTPMLKLSPAAKRKSRPSSFSNSKSKKVHLHHALNQSWDVNSHLNLPVQRWTNILLLCFLLRFPHLKSMPR